MTRPTRSPSLTLALRGAALAAFGALLPGCPVWSASIGTRLVLPGDDGGAVIVPQDSGPSGLPCLDDLVCPTGEHCGSRHTCETGTRCTAGSCARGSYCAPSGVCEVGCATQYDCDSYGNGLRCDTAAHRCVPAAACSSSGTCPSGQACLDGICRTGSSVCRFDYQCSGGQRCIDGRCQTSCRAGSNDCGTGLVCVSGTCQLPAAPADGCASCAAGTVCAGGRCLTSCFADGNCATGWFCESGACRPDDRRPAPFCTNNSGCVSGSACVDGVCRIACPSGTDNECLLRDGSNFPICGSVTVSGSAVRICQSPSERAPQCARNADCSATQICANAACVSAR